MMIDKLQSAWQMVRNTFDQCSDKFENIEAIEWLDEPAVQIVAAVVIAICVALLLYRIYKLSRKVKTMSESKSVNNVSTAQEKCEQTAATPDVTNKLPVAESLSPTLAIVFTFRQTEKDGRPLKFLVDKIKERIEQTQMPAGMIGSDYQCEFDLGIEEVEILSAPVEASTKITQRFKDNGFAVELKGNVIRLTGKPQKEFDGKLFFAYQTLEQLQKRQEEKAKGNTENLCSNYETSKPFIINAHPKSLWLDLPVEDYEGYVNNDNEASGETVAYVPGVKKNLPFLNTPAKQFEVIAASVRGRSHAHIAKPRDDAFHFEFDKETGWNFVAVADGAGSAKYSRKGSEIATKAVIQKLRENLTNEFTQTCFVGSPVNLQRLQRWKYEFLKASGKPTVEQEEFIANSKIGQVFDLAVHAAYSAIYAEHKQRKDSVLKDYHTTLICAAFRWFPELDNHHGGWFVASYWVGDGGAAILKPTFDKQSVNAAGVKAETDFPTNRVFVLGEPDGGEFAGQTRFLTMPEEIDLQKNPEKIRSRCRFSFCDSFDAMLLVSDGITDPFFPSEAAVADEHRWLEFYEAKLKNGCEEEREGCKEVFDNKIAPPKKAEALLRWLNFWSKGNHDDRTILIVKPVGS